MTIQEILANLERTIAGKEALLKSYEGARKRNLDIIADTVAAATVGFLQVNIDELRKIKEDLEKI